jgi:hypothetical protein
MEITLLPIREMVRETVPLGFFNVDYDYPMNYPTIHTACGLEIINMNTMASILG